MWTYGCPNMEYVNAHMLTHAHREPFSAGLVVSLITAEPCLIPQYRLGNQAGTVESNI